MYVCFDFVYHISKLCGFLKDIFGLYVSWHTPFTYTITLTQLHPFRNFTPILQFTSILYFTFILQFVFIPHFTSILHHLTSILQSPPFFNSPPFFFNSPPFFISSLSFFNSLPSLHLRNLIYSCINLVLVQHTVTSCSPFNRQLLRQQHV